MRLSNWLISLAITIISTSSVIAAEGHDHASKPIYGGVLASANEVDYELVAKGDSLTLYVVDHGKPVAASGIKASATVYAGSDKTVVTLEPAGENKLVAKGSFKGGVGVRVAVAVTLPGKSETKVSFRLK